MKQAPPPMYPQPGAPQAAPAPRGQQPPGAYHGQHQPGAQAYPGTGWQGQGAPGQQQPQVVYVQAPAGAQQQQADGEEPFLKGDRAAEDVLCLAWLVFCFPCSLCCFLPYYMVRS